MDKGQQAQEQQQDGKGDYAGQEEPMGARLGRFCSAGVGCAAHQQAAGIRLLSYRESRFSLRRFINFEDFNDNVIWEFARRLKIEAHLTIAYA
jgi:hypothetical protein